MFAIGDKKMNEATLQNIEKYLKNLAALTTIIIFVFVIAIVAMVMSISSCNSSFSAPHTYRCVVPKTDLPEGHVLTTEDLAMRDIVFSNYNSEVFYDKTAYLLVGKAITKSISSGDPISKDHLVAEEKWPPEYEDPKL